MHIQYSKQTIQPVKYTGEVSLNQASRQIGARIQKGNQPNPYQVTRIEPNGLCFGVRVDFLDRFRRP